MMLIAIITITTLVEGLWNHHHKHSHHLYRHLYHHHQHYYHHHRLPQQMAKLVTENMERHGTKFLLNTMPEKFERSGRRVKVTWRGSDTGSNSDIFDTVLMAIGRFDSPLCCRLGRACADWFELTSCRFVNVRGLLWWHRWSSCLIMPSHHQVVMAIANGLV